MWFQLNEAPFTVFSQVVTDVSSGAGTIDVDVDIPMNVPAGTFNYRYLAFIAPDGEGIDNSFSDLIQF